MPERTRSGNDPRVTNVKTVYLLGAVGAVAFVLAGVLVAVSLMGSKSSSPTPAGAPLIGVGDSLSLFEGIPQHGIVLGSPKAPATVVEYADLQCPYCARFATTELPAFVQKYVRTGKAKLEFRGLAFVGQDSLSGLHTALAAARQNRLWQVIDILYTNQGAENSGWLSDSLLRDVGAAVPGLSTQAMFAARSEPSIEAEIQAASTHATNDGVNATPTLFAGPTGGTLRRVDTASAAALAQAVQSALAG
jgi:protein-disulfide isomerase